MVGIFEIVNAGIQRKVFNGKESYTLACLQNADLTQVKISDDNLLKQCQGLEMYKPVRIEIDVTKGNFNGNTYVNYKLVKIAK